LVRTYTFLPPVTTRGRPFRRVPKGECIPNEQHVNAKQETGGCSYSCVLALIRRWAAVALRDRKAC
jgi:hypothetical protein